MSIHFQAKQLIRSTTSVHLVSWAMQQNDHGHSYGQLVIGSFIMTKCSLMNDVSCRVFWWNIKSSGWFSPPSAQIWHLQFLAFPKIKITFEREETSDHRWDSGNMTGLLVAIPTKDFAEYFEQWTRHWDNCVRSQSTYFEGDWDDIVLCTMFLVSCIFFKTVSIFHITWLDTFWTSIINIVKAMLIFVFQKYYKGVLDTFHTFNLCNNLVGILVFLLFAFLYEKTDIFWVQTHSSRDSGWYLFRNQDCLILEPIFHLLSFCDIHSMIYLFGDTLLQHLQIELITYTLKENLA